MKHELRSSSIIGALGAIAIAIMGLLGYLPGMELLGSVKENYIPMAPSTAICFIVLGFVLLILKVKQLSGTKAIILLIVTFLVSLFGILEVAGHFSGIDLNFEDTLIPTAGNLNGVPIARMSPATGAAFFLSGVAAFFLILQRKFPKRNTLIEYFGSGLGILALLISFVFCLAYLYGTPLLYGHGVTIPMALTTALGFMFLSISILTFERDAFPLRLLTGASTRSYLLRFILPLSTLSVILGGVVVLSSGQTSKMNPAFISAALTVLIAMVTGFVATLISRHLGKKIDRSEETLHQYAHIVSSSTDMLALINKKYIYIATNNAYLQGFNLTSKKLVGHTISDVFGEEFFNTVIKSKADRCLAGEEVNFQSWVIFPKSGKRYMDATYYPYTDAKNTIQGFVVNSRDITERKLNEENLRQSEERFRKLTETAFEGIVIAEKGKILEASAKFARLFGYEPSEVIGMIASDLIAPDYRDQVMEYILKDYEKPYEAVGLRKGGSTFQFEAHGIKTPYHGITARLTAIRDITERKQAENALKKSEEKFRNYVETSQDLIWECDSKGRFIYLNPAWEQVTGYRLKEMLGKPFTDFTKKEEVEKNAAEFAKHLKGGFVKGFPSTYISKDGSELFLIFNALPLYDSNKNIIGTQGSAYDITERKQAEAALHQYAHIVSSSTDMLALLNKKYIYNAANNAYLQGFNLTSAQLIGHTASEVLGEEFFNTVIKPKADRCLAGEEVNYKEWFNFPSSGKRYMDVTYYPYTNSENKVQGFVVNWRDVTEQYKIEEELFKARKLESVGVLAGGIAHDFNNILTALFGNMELAKLSLPRDHAAYVHIETANQALERATNLTKQFLTFAKGGDPILEAVNMKQAIQDSIAFNLSGSNVKTALSLPDNLWQIKADKGQLSQVIANLAINAKQAMPEGGTLHIDAENIEELKEDTASHLSGVFVKLCMRDEGSGIAEKHLEKIFDPYFSTKQTGSGLGLATVHSIIAKHKGHISVDSKLGIGSTFTIYLPAEKSALRSTATTYPDMTEKLTHPSRHLLIMDDEEMIRDLSTEMLGVCGYTVDSAIDGKEAIEKYISAAKTGYSFDIVIMDLTIPGGMGGKETIKKLLTIDPKAKVIVSSGYSTDPIIANYSDYGFRGRLVKPFKIEDLENELSRVMELG